MSKILNAQWWHCHHDIEKNERIDMLSQRGLAQGYRVAVLATPEQLVSNLTVQENIELPKDWRSHDTVASEHDSHIADAIRQCLQHCLRAHQNMDLFLHLQGARLSTRQKRWIGVARALHSCANYVVIDDDENNLYPFEDERLQFIAEYLPDATIHWISLRAPATLPDGWLFAEPGVNA